MPKMIQIRNVPDELHARLVARAAESGLSLSTYLLQELRKGPGRLSTAEIVARAKERGPVGFSMEDVVADIRAVRDASE